MRNGHVQPECAVTFTGIRNLGMARQAFAVITLQIALATLNIRGMRKTESDT